jgi:hypothetical protein
MQIHFIAPALLLAGAAAAQDAGRPDPREPRAKTPPVEYRSAFEGYRPFADPQLRDWRKSNEEVAKPPAGQPQPGKPGPSGQHGSHK